MNIYNALLIWRPMLLGILCVFFSMLARLKKGRHLELRGLVLVPIGIITVICLFFTSAQTPWQWKEGRPSSKELVETVNNLRSAKGVSLLWYRNINPQILDFYSIQSTGRSFPIYRGENYNSLWSPWDYSSENRKRVASEITEQFNNAELVLIPEYIDMYSPGEPYAMYKFKDLFNELYLAGALPDMEIIGKLRDSNSDRILILRKLTGKSKKEADKTWKPINRE